MWTTRALLSTGSRATLPRTPSVVFRAICECPPTRLEMASRVRAMFATPGLLGPIFIHASPPLVPRRIRRAPVTEDEHPHAWRLIRDELRRAVPDSTWHQWLAPLTGRDGGDGTELVEAPANLRPWVAKRYG